MSRVSNYIVDTNRFRLAGPPQWFLGKLWDYDPSLVLIPSRMGFYYRLGQRRKLNLPERIVNDVLREEDDTKMLASYGLVPVTTVLATCDWSNPVFFEELSRRAPWRNGGAENYTKMVEGQERQQEFKKRIEQDEKLDYLARDSWKYYNKKIGLRSQLYSPKTKNTQPVSPGLRRVSKKQAYCPDIVTSWNPNLIHR